MRQSGQPWQSIATELGLPRTTVYRAVRRALAANEIASEESMAVLGQMLAGLMPEAIGGDPKAVAQAMHVHARMEQLRERSPRRPRLRTAFEATVQALEVEPVDSALVASGEAITEHVDLALVRGDAEEIKAALYLVPHLVNVLKQLRATPAARAEVVTAPAAEPPRELSATEKLQARWQTPA